MNIIFLTLVDINSLEERGIYQDLLRKFRDEGHHVTVVSPVERRKKIDTNLKKTVDSSILKVKTFNIQKTNFFEKGIGTLALEYQYLSAIKKHLAHSKFDLILYSTPPITLVKVIEYLKMKNNAKTYLLLKDIFPQNAVDMQMIKQGGMFHKHFLKIEKKLYQISDTIGCMSPANVNFLLQHNPEVQPEKVEVNPNTIEPVSFNYTEEEKLSIRVKYGIPTDKKVLVYGGNLGKPQGLDFLLETISETKDPKAFFLIVGGGTEYDRIKHWFESNIPGNAKLIKHLPKEDYDRLLAAGDVGLIFLDKNFLIPNFPSRLLSYLEMKMPVIAATDPNTDIGDIIENAQCGFKVLSGDQKQMQDKLHVLLHKANLQELAANAEKLVYNEYLVEKSYNLIVQKCNV